MTEWLIGCGKCWRNEVIVLLYKAKGAEQINHSGICCVSVVEKPM